MEKKYLKVYNKENLIISSTVEVKELHSKTQLDFYFKDTLISTVDTYAFVALTKIRKKLEAIELKIICQGSRVDVYPSGMQLGGLLAYELELSKPATNSVYIFDDTPFIDKIVTVKKQEEFFEKWLQSLGFNSRNNNDLYDPKSSIGMYWYLVNLDNWHIQSKEYKSAIISNIRLELGKIKRLESVNFLLIQRKFEEALKIDINGSYS